MKKWNAQLQAWSIRSGYGSGLWILLVGVGVAVLTVVQLGRLHAQEGQDSKKVTVELLDEREGGLVVGQEKSTRKRNPAQQ